jgi:hypothetical protein
MPDKLTTLPIVRGSGQDHSSRNRADRAGEGPADRVAARIQHAFEALHSRSPQWLRNMVRSLGDEEHAASTDQAHKQSCQQHCGENTAQHMHRAFICGGKVQFAVPFFLWQCRVPSALHSNTMWLSFT